MRVVALVSGGKDSCYNMMQCVAEGHTIVALANLRPEKKDEIDSYMFQTVGHDAIDLYAKAMDIPLYRRTLFGESVVLDRDYIPDPMDEVEDLFQLLHNMQRNIDFEGVSVGAVLSDYQRVRVESVCSRLGLTSLSYLWRRSQQELLLEMIACQVKAIVIKVAALGLDPSKHLGKTIEDIYPHMCAMKLKYGLNVCGEGGEYETFTLDCPLFKKKLVVYETVKVTHSDNPITPVAYLKLTNVGLEEKSVDVILSMQERIQGLQMKTSRQLHQELILTNEPQEELQPGPIAWTPSIKTNTWQQKTGLSGELTCKHYNGYLCVSGITATGDEVDLSTLTTTAMDQLKGTLHNNGMDMSHIFLVHLYVKNMAKFVEINSVYRQYFTINPPARVCVQAALPGNTQLQIDYQAHRATDPNTIDIVMARNTMHVQSLSHWAPANIGPYSQATQIGNAYFLAGQIGMCPANLELIEGGIHPQARLSVRSVGRVLEAMNPKLDISSAMQVVCYVTHQNFIPVAEKEWMYALERTEMRDGYSGEECATSGVITYIVVPSLPKKALIEWHVIAHSNKPTWKYSQRRPTDWSNYTLTCETCYSLDDSLGAMQVSVEVTRDGEDLNLQEMTKKLLDVVRKEGLPWKQMMVLRIFYHSDVFKHGELYSTFEECLEEVSEDMPAFSLVPAVGLRGRNVLSVCCWMQG
ncbi:uncharacterized protein LOC144451142 [Glandiceps talaboti]